MNNRKPCLGQSLGRLGPFHLGLGYLVIIAVALGFAVGQADAAETVAVETGQAGTADVFAIEIGKAQLIQLSATPDVIMLGNPAVADVVVEDNGLLFLLGREPGETNMLILDDTGKVVISAAIVVGPMKKRRVTVDRGPQAFTLSCNPRCVPVATPQGSGATTAAAAGAASAGGEEAEQAAAGDPAAEIANALSGLLGNQQGQE
ncbi:MAG: hypothetical protein HOA08_22540 [Rhodospirillaceae bacterium]|jgi:Flp pilus assembly secretin CpaC|nr:hypothetical protein [Rhodospirillaceae bacterium]MBT3782384.1 hypothetical protein [Rhodospirillaceae bacterium]MBT3976024.1 hypothetical protein [Rhodospirillaceae bacterium]MBT4167453.1 hypothetical protein [Rhodospirillaceae bacterium]MBT4566077.1 hypothetical protein [Rhodospirillaceae bacterium]